MGAERFERSSDLPPMIVPHLKLELTFRHFVKRNDTQYKEVTKQASVQYCLKVAWSFESYRCLTFFSTVVNNEQYAYTASYERLCNGLKYWL